MPGGGGNGVCRITCSPTPLVRGPFQRATSWPRLSDLLDGLLLTEQPLGKIYSLRLILAGPSRRHRTVPQALRERSSQGRQRDHPGEEAAHGDDRDEHADHTRVHRLTSLCFDSRRSAKSNRSASSATSCRTCCSSFRISMRSPKSPISRRAC